MTYKTAIFVLSFLYSICCASVPENIIHPDSHKVLTQNVAIRDPARLFDNDYGTQTLIHSEVNEIISVLILLPKEFRIDKVEIISEDPLQLKQSIRVGYIHKQDEISSDVLYSCVPNKTSTVCQPICVGQSNREHGVSGAALLWSLERTADKGWSRIYEVVIQGTAMDDIRMSVGKTDDISLLKPYSEEELTSTSEVPSCKIPVWQLTDTSMADSKMPAISSVPHKVTIHLGQRSSVSGLGLIVSTVGEAITESVFSFSGPSKFEKTINFNQDCTVKDPAKGLLLCETPELSGYPFDNVTVDTKGLVRLHLYGKPFYYPTIGIIPSAKITDSVSDKYLYLKCLAVSCGSQLAVTLNALVRGKSPSQCSMTGQTVECANLELLRVHLGANGDKEGIIPDAVLVSHGQILPEVTEVMTELQLMNSSTSQLTVKLPRTHPYFGQYKCRCHADDKVDSVIESAQTALASTEFDQDLVFQRNYTALFKDELVENHLGFFELPDEPQTNYFNLLVAGHSLTEKLDLNVTYLESGNLASMSGDYAQKSSVPAFPRAKGANYAWPIVAYRVELQEAWPDLADGSSIQIEWKTNDDAVSVRSMKDEIRTIVLSSSRDGLMRGWLWGRSEELLDIRAYYQVGSNPIVPTELYLQRSGCTVNNAAERVGSIKLTEEGCIADNTLTVVPGCIRTQAGFAIQFVQGHPSTSDTYILYHVAGVNKPDEPLVTSVALMQNLEQELNNAEVTMKIEAVRNNDNSETSEMRAAVVVHSKVLMDNSACRPMHLSLHPAWPLSDKLESPLVENVTRFDIPVPNDQSLLTIDMEIRVQSGGESLPELTTRRSLTLPNPRHYKIELKIDENSGDIEWPAMPLPFRGLLDKFQVKIYREKLVCGLREEIEAPTLREEFNGSPVYKIRLSEVTGFQSDFWVNYEIEVTPLLKTHGTETAPVAGTKTIAKLSKGKLDSTLIRTGAVSESRTARLYVVPSQVDQCIKQNNEIWAKFNLQVIGEDAARPSYLTDVSFEPDPLGDTVDSGRWYTARNLLPGRRYEVNATVIYPTGIQDKPSAFAQFWTTDEVSVSPSEISATPGESVTFNCTGAVGPDGPYRKQLEWKRKDGTPLPDGSHSEIVQTAETGPEWHETVSLIFGNVEPGQSNNYACFIRPAVLELIGKPYTPLSVRLSVSGMFHMSQSTYYFKCLVYSSKML